MNAMPTFTVLIHRSIVGYVNAVSFAQAVKRARKLHGQFCDVELCVNVAPLAKDRLNANRAESVKTARRYTDVAAFNARRVAMVAEFKANA